jgi:hypothetical protein
MRENGRVLFTCEFDTNETCDVIRLHHQSVSTKGYIDESRI